MEHSIVSTFKFALNEDEARELLEWLSQPNAYSYDELHELREALRNFCDQHTRH